MTQAAQATAHAVLAEVHKRIAPAVIANLQSNADQIALHLKRNRLEWNADNVVAAINALHAQGKILWEVDPIEVSPAELLRIQKQKDKERAAAEDAKFKPGVRHVDAIAADNTSAADKAKNAAEVKQLETLKSEIAKEINGYFVGHPSGGRNYGRSEEGQTKLRAVAGNYQQLTNVDAVKRVLESVKTAKHRLP
jgi:hypothetical protein